MLSENDLECIFSDVSIYKSNARDELDDDIFFCNWITSLLMGSLSLYLPHL